MSDALPIVILAAWSAICNVWGYLLFLQVQAKRKGWLLACPATDSALPRQSGQTVRIVVPVRNVGAGVAPCLQSIVSQQNIDWRLTVVDDRSEDDTPAQLRTLAGDHRNVHLMRIETLPPGWLGKSHALWTAAIKAEEDWLLFLDDDCVLDPGAAQKAVEYANSQAADLLTLWPRHLARTFWEHMIIPLCGGVIALWFGSPEINRDSGSVAFANGQFLLIRREAYRRIGGHSCVRSAIIEDVPLAEAARQAGLRCRVASGANLFGVRMYRTYRATVDGWTRIFVGALRSGPKLLVSMAWLFFGNLWPYLAVLPCLCLSAQPERSWIWPAALAMAVMHLVLMMVASYRFWGLGRCDRRHLWLYPVSVLVVLRILAGSWYVLVVRRRVSWRNTEYVIDGAGRIVNV